MHHNPTYQNRPEFRSVLILINKRIIYPHFGNNENNVNYFLKEVFCLIRKVEIASVNTSKLPVLSNEEKNELLKKIKQGDKNAREEFINGNLRLVLSVIQRFRRKRRIFR